MSVVRLLVLGILRMRGRAHGYAVHRELMEWKIETWTRVKPASIYHAVKQLAKEEKLRTVGTESSTEGPGRTVYEITPAGDTEFFLHLESALRSVDIEEFGAGFAFVQCLSRKRALELIREQLEKTEEVRDGLKAMMPDYPRPYEPPHTQDLLLLWSSSFASNADWTLDLLKRLERGEYVMAGDQDIARGR